MRNLSLNTPRISQVIREIKVVGTRIGRTINTSRNKAISTIKTKTVNIKATTSNNLTPAVIKCTSKSITTTRIIHMEITIIMGIKARTTVRIATRATGRTKITVPIQITNRITNRTSKGQ